ncbi:type II toxin-antitoxin system HicB family antitoxin [Enterocloster bolteae]|mgnify:FL=1|uniref:type II toxin-antitoxin system HicB family antitoxin n=1 Tax=Enterocloster bolteae TaxID=208479 RepID=UPI002674E95D|nr:type II toxin-antitoxin system HicB family antitoxin [Enterocloster bolteae]
MIVDVPEIYGCMADGASPVEALENVETIIDEWFETVRAIWCEIPETKGRLLYA